MASKMPGQTAVVIRTPIPSRGVSPHGCGPASGLIDAQYLATTAASAG